MDLLEGPDPTFFEDHDRGKPTREVQVGEKSTVQTWPMGTVARSRYMSRTNSSSRKRKNPNHVLGPDDVRQALEQARSQGCPSLSAAADEALQGASSNRAGYSPNVGQLSQLQWKDGIGHGTLTWAGGSWDVWDYGDKLHPTGSWQKETFVP